MDDFQKGILYERANQALKKFDKVLDNADWVLKTKLHWNEIDQEYQILLYINMHEYDKLKIILTFPSLYWDMPNGSIQYSEVTRFYGVQIKTIKMVEYANY